MLNCNLHATLSLHCDFVKPGLSGGAIAGISIAAVAVVLLAVFVFIRFYRKNKVKEAILLSKSQEHSPQIVNGISIFITFLCL